MERDKITTNADTGQVAQPDAKRIADRRCGGNRSRKLSTSTKLDLKNET